MTSNGGVFLLLGVGWAAYLVHPERFEGQPYVILLGGSYCLTSISMNTLNKVCVSLTLAPSAVTLIQMWIALVIVASVHWREVLQTDRKQLLCWCVVPILYAGMLNSSLR